MLERREPRLAEMLPARSTAAALLKRHGLITSPRRRRALGHPGRPTTPMEEPNAIWTADFKGQFKTGDGRYCFPLTVADGASRYLLACCSLTSVRTVARRASTARDSSRSSTRPTARSGSSVATAASAGTTTG